MTRKVVRILLWSIACGVVVTIALLIYLANAGISGFKDQVEHLVSSATGYQFEIDGRFELQLGATSRVVAERVSLKNPGRHVEPDLLGVEHMVLVIDTRSIFGSTLIIEEFSARNIGIRVALDEGGRSNWTPLRAAEESENTGEVDTDRIAFRKVSIDGIRFSYKDPRWRRPVDAVIESATIEPDASDVLDLALHGFVNDLPLSAHGKLGPWQNFVDGRDITADLDLTLGKLRLSLAGSAEDVLFLEGIAGEAELAGPDAGRVIETLGLPPFADGPFDVQARITALDNGHQVRLAGNIGAIEVLVGGSIDSLAATEHADLDFSFSGPDLQYLAEFFGVDGAPPMPFRVAGGLKLDDSLVGLNDLLVEVGRSTVSVDGKVDFGQGAPDGNLAITGRGPDFSVFGPFLKRDGLPKQAFNIAGEVSKRGNRWEVRALEALVGENRLSAHGSMSVGSGEDSAIDFHASGPDVSLLQDFTDLQGLPNRPFDVQASLRSDPGGMAVRDALGVFGDNRLELEGIVSNMPGMAGTALRVRASGPELQDVAVLTDVPHLPAGPFDISAQVEMDGETVLFSEVTAKVGALAASGSGEVGFGARADYLALTADLQAPDAAQFVAVEYLEPFAGESLSIRGSFRKTGDDLEIEDARADIGDFHLSAQGTLSLSPKSNSSDLGFLLRGPSMERVGQMFDSDLLLDKPFSVSGQFRGTPVGFAMQDFEAQVGDSDIKGDFSADLRGKPIFAGRLTSEYLDLRDRVQAMVESEEPSEKSDADTSEFVFSDQPIDGQQLNAVNIDVEIDVGRLRTHALDVTDFHVGFRMWDGALRIDPVRMIAVPGSLTGRMSLVPDANRYTFESLIEAEQLHVGLSSTADQDPSTLPPVSGRIELRGVGNSPHQIVAASNGAIAVRQGQGEVKEFFAAILFRDIVLEALQTINPLRKDSALKRLDCGIYEISIADGVAVFDRVAMQTDRLSLLVTGNIDLDTEALDINFRARPREGLGVSLGTIANSFLAVHGTLRSPRVVLDATNSVTATGAAVATGGLSLLARGLWDRLSAEQDICAQTNERE